MDDTTGSITGLTVRLTGKDGNAFAIIARCLTVMRRAHLPEEDCARFEAEAKSGDYDHVLQTAMRWFDVE